MSAAAREAERLLRTLQATRTVVEHGRVVQAGGTVLRATGLRARIGQQCRIADSADAADDAGAGLIAEVIGFAGAEIILAPYGPLQGVAVGAAVQALADEAAVPCGPALLGRVIDAFGQAAGRPSPGRRRGPGQHAAARAGTVAARAPRRRRAVADRRAAHRFGAHGGEGQRVGIFAMAGGGKSTCSACWRARRVPT
jgi:type III secretion protein N (ATPase)